MTRDELEAEIEKASGFARQTIEGGKEYLPMLVLFGFPMADTITPVLLAEGIDAVSRKLVRRTAEAAARANAHMIQFSSETWFSRVRTDDPRFAERMAAAKRREIHLDPGRLEALMIGGAAPGCGVVTCIWEIVRDDRGNRKLGERVQADRFDNYFLDNLPWPVPDIRA